ncbi:alpha-amylase family glycosyl hydrolase [Pelagibacterium lacus]|uniref:Alpha-glucosidase n=1 Tax=Pelagibacterium lacus TaxID=2282655 RepID=A0A369W0X0_9HYPH|nr:alpha-amylase family glycosyl hydrolase [Pelagibacterium lacus]RDE08013.1 alpha-glucosidase [Pelagibacterium lacus]
MGDWWRGGVIYQIYPRSFQDSNGDGVGDLRGILGRLDHVASLGVDAIWLSPIFTSPMADMGYDVSNYTDIDPLFGALADFDALIERAHDLGLKVIIDQVVSHTSDRHPWFIESRSSRTNSRADWYVWAEPNEDGTPPNNWPSVFGGPAWEWNGTRRQYYLHNFLIEQPDLNFHNPEVQDAVLDAMRFWLERGVDGFRFDTVNYYFHDRQLRDNPAAPREKETPLEVDPYGMQLHTYSKNRPENIDFLKRVRQLMDEFPGTTTVGEVGEAHRPIEIMAEYTAGGDRLHMCYSFSMLGPEFTPRHFRSRIEGFFSGAPDGWPCWSFSNHDVNRHVTRWEAHAANPDALARLAIAMQSTFKGSVCLYQGEELGLPETELDYGELTDPPGLRFWPENKGRDGCRTPMPWTGDEHGGFSDVKPWLPVKAPQRKRNVAALDADPDSILNYYRAILAYRREVPALVGGEIVFYDVERPILAFARHSGQTALVCVFNLSALPRGLAVDGLPPLATVAAVSTGAELGDGGLALKANGFAIIECGAGFDPAALTLALIEA